MELSCTQTYAFDYTPREEGDTVWLSRRSPPHSEFPLKANDAKEADSSKRSAHPLVSLLHENKENWSRLGTQNGVEQGKATNK